MNEPTDVANDAQLIQLARSSLGRDAATPGASRPNVSSCGRVVTLHGVACDPEERRAIEEAARRTPGVLDVVNKLTIVPDRSESQAPHSVL